MFRRRRRRPRTLPATVIWTRAHVRDRQHLSSRPGRRAATAAVAATPHAGSGDCRTGCSVPGLLPSALGPSVADRAVSYRDRDRDTTVVQLAPLQCPPSDSDQRADVRIYGRSVVGQASLRDTVSRSLLCGHILDKITIRKCDRLLVRPDLELSGKSHALERRQQGIELDS